MKLQGNGHLASGTTRVLLAVDGSPASLVARDLVASLAWPRDTAIRVVGVLEETRALFGVPWLAVAPLDMAELEAKAALAMRAAARETAAGLRAAGVAAEGVLLRGRPASAIVEEARRVDSQLIVVGSHGHERLERALLGSVSGEVVDHAPAPVLVARTPTVRRIILADDGSAEAAGARHLVAEWPIFHDIPVTVVSVADVTLRPPAELVPFELAGRAEPAGRTEPLSGAYGTSRAVHGRIAEEGAAELAEAGLAVSVNVRAGHAAEEIMRAAVEGGADLIVAGSRGHSALERLLLGSVARDVLLHAACSVLIVRGQPSRRRPAQPEEPVRASSSAGRSRPGVTSPTA